MANLLSTLVLCGLTVGILSGPLVRQLNARALLDVPGDRSSHTTPTPKGGGLLIIPVILVAWVLIVTTTSIGTISTHVLVVALAALTLWALSWIDDLRQLPAGLRLAAHAACVAIVMAMLPTELSLFQGVLPVIVERVLLGVVWVWFINLFNFMDGIDGITSIECIVIGAGVLLLSVAVPVDGNIVSLFAAIAGAALGFIPWNWHPAKVFMGDCGSAPLGFLIGFGLIVLAFNGYWIASITLPAYYLVDSGVTLLRRLIAGQKIWHAHREHAYQNAAQAWGHAQVSLLVGVAGLLLIGASLLSSMGHIAIGLCLGALISIGIYIWLARAS